MNDYDQYEQKCSEIRSENQQLLSGFDSWLANAGLSNATIDRHKSNVEFYIDDFLLYYDATKACDGVGTVGIFLGDWFIRKAMWASESGIKSNATSLKKFYTFMFERGAIDQESLQALKTEIKENLSEWVVTIRRYDDPTVDLEDIW